MLLPSLGVSSLTWAALRGGPFSIERTSALGRRGSALHYFTVHNITWRALPAAFGDWNAVWKRFGRLSRSGVFDAMFEALAATSATAHLVQMLDSTTARAHVSAAGSKGGRTAKLLAARAAASRPRSTSRPTSAACRSPST